MILEWNTEVSKNILERLLDAIDDLASADPFFEHPWVIEVSEKASSSKTSYRELIRQRLIENLVRFSGPLNDDPNFPFFSYFPGLARGLTRTGLQTHMMDLNQPPQLEGVKISISHNPLLGGFIISDEAAGFDIEDRNRIEPKLIQRIASAEEMKVAPFPAAIWGAKESAWKAIQNSSRVVVKPTVMTDIEITSWKVLQPSRIETFEIKSSTSSGNQLLTFPEGVARGCVIYLDSHLFSFFFIK